MRVDEVVGWLLEGQGGAVGGEEPESEASHGSEERAKKHKTLRNLCTPLTSCPCRARRIVEVPHWIRAFRGRLAGETIRRGENGFLIPYCMPFLYFGVY